MSSYPLSAKAKQAEASWRRAPMEQKDVWSLDTGRASFHDQDNFTTNRVTVSDYQTSVSGNAVGLSATWACVNLLAGTIASLPLMVYKRGADGRQNFAPEHPLYYILHDSPNYDQCALDFWEFMCAALELRGNAYAQIARRSDGTITSLTPISPDVMRVTRNSRGDIVYNWTVNGKAEQGTQKNVFHIRGFGGDALGGVSPLSACRQIFNGALDAERTANGMFANGATPSGVLTTDKTMTSDQRREAERLLQEKFVGARNTGRPMLLDNGLKWQQLTLSPEDTQMLESRRFSVEEICRVFGIPPHMIGHTTSSTSWGTGLEQQTTGFLIFTLRRRLKRIEQAIAKQLLTTADRAANLSSSFNIEGLLRADSAGRSAFYREMTQIGTMTINEVRALENLPPVEGGDVPRMQMQNVPITQAGQE